VDNHAYPRSLTLIFGLWVAFLTWPDRLPLIIRIVGKRRIERAFREFAASLPATNEV
jgi:hypothetical protein